MPSTTESVIILRGRDEVTAAARSAGRALEDFDRQVQNAVRGLERQRAATKQWSLETRAAERSGATFERGLSFLTRELAGLAAGTFTVDRAARGFITAQEQSANATAQTLLAVQLLGPAYKQVADIIEAEGVRLADQFATTVSDVELAGARLALAVGDPTKITQRDLEAVIRLHKLTGLSIERSAEIIGDAINGNVAALRVALQGQGIVPLVGTYEEALAGLEASAEASISGWERFGGLWRRIFEDPVKFLFWPFQDDPEMEKRFDEFGRRVAGLKEAAGASRSFELDTTSAQAALDALILAITTARALAAQPIPLGPLTGVGTGGVLGPGGLTPGLPALPPTVPLPPPSYVPPLPPGLEPDPPRPPPVAPPTPPGIEPPYVPPPPGAPDEWWELPRFAHGGVVTRPTHAMIGESGPEAVVPLGRSGGVGGTVVVNINNPVVDSEVRQRQLVRDVAAVLREETRRSAGALA